MCSQQQHRFLYKAYKKSITAQYNQKDSTAQLYLYLNYILLSKWNSLTIEQSIVSN